MEHFGNFRQHEKIHSLVGDTRDTVSTLPCSMVGVFNIEDKDAAPVIAKLLLEVEAQSLQDRYGFGGGRSEEQVLLHNMEVESLSECGTQLEAIRTKC